MRKWFDFSKKEIQSTSLNWVVTKILVRGTNFFMENWSSPENFGPTMDQFSMEFWHGGTIFFRKNWSGDHFFQKKMSGRIILSWKIRFYQSFDILDFLILFNCRTTKLFDPGLTIHILVFNTLDGQYSGVQNS